MKKLAIKAENISKQYRLGEIGTGTLSHDLNRLWYKMRGKEDPYLKIGESNERSKKGESEYVWSLRDINFEIEQGDAVGIIGRNGAGKSTLLKILSKVTKPTTGNIKVNGRIASLLEVGTGFNPEMTGRENIYLNGAILGMRKDEITRKLDEIIDFSGVERYIDTPVKRYSSGMYVRLAFAVAANLESEILIVDEVLAVGDSEFQKKCLGKMGEVSKGEGRTVLFVSHNMASIAQLCGTGLLLQNGKVNYTGEISKVINTYLANKEIQHIYEVKNKLNDISIVRQYLSTNDLEIRNTFRFEELITINFTLLAKLIEKNSTLSLFVYNQREELIFCNHLKISDYLKLGESNLTAQLPIKLLLPGSYTVNSKIHIPNVKFIDQSNNSIDFSIEDTGHEHSAYKINLGLISVDVKWDVKD